MRHPDPNSFWLCKIFRCLLHLKLNCSTNNEIDPRESSPAYYYYIFFGSVSRFQIINNNTNAIYNFTICNFSIGNHFHRITKIVYINMYGHIPTYIQYTFSYSNKHISIHNSGSLPCINHNHIILLKTPDNWNCSNKWTDASNISLPHNQKRQVFPCPGWTGIPAWLAHEIKTDFCFFFQIQNVPFVHTHTHILRI